MVNLVVALFLFWMVTADRILEEDGQLASQQLTRLKMGYAGVLWLEMIVVIMVYSMEQLN